MALEKSIEQPTGATATYWKISKIEIDITKGETAVNADGYVSRDARVADMAELTDVWFHFPFTLETIDTDIVAWAYGKIKQLPEWADAKDIPEETQ